MKSKGIYTCLFFMGMGIHSLLFAQDSMVLGVYSPHGTRSGVLKAAQAQNVQAYCFGHDSKVDWDKKTISYGRVFENDRWCIKYNLPLPKVVYDYSFYYLGKNRPFREYSHHYLQELKDKLNVPFINPGHISDQISDKRFTGKIMQEYGVPHPETHLSGPDINRQMISKFDYLFFKPQMGCQGSGIFNITKENGMLISRFKVESAPDVWVDAQVGPLPEESLEDIIAESKRQMKISAKNPYLVQQGIKAFELRGAPTYMRVLTQRGEDGKLDCTALGSRLNGHNSQGGSSEHYAVITGPLAKSSKCKYGQVTVESNFLQVAVKAHEAIEKKFGTKVGELGMDLVADENGDVYFIEANPKCGVKSIFPYNDTCEQRASDLRDEKVVSFARHLHESKK